METLVSAVRSVVMVVIVLAFASACVAANQQAVKDQTGKAGDVERGKKLFSDQKLGGGTSGKSCVSCHKDGKGLEKVTEKKEFRAMGKTYKSLEEVINYFIETALHGKALDPDSDEMRDLIAYLKSL